MFGKKKPSDPSAEWTKTGSFVHKPSRGWLHSDNSLMEGGVCYAVKVSLYVVLASKLTCVKLILSLPADFNKHAFVLIKTAVFFLSD